MDSARREQIEIFRSWSPGQRLEAAARLIDLAVALRDGVGRHGAKAPKGSSRAVRVTDVR